MALLVQRQGAKVYKHLNEMDYYEELDFEDKYADEFEILRDLENDESEPVEFCRPNSRSSRPKSRNEIDSNTKPNHIRNLLQSFGGSDDNPPQGHKRSLEETDVAVENAEEPLQGLRKRMRLDDGVRPLEENYDIDNQLNTKTVFTRTPCENCIAIQSTGGYKLYTKLRNDLDGKDIYRSKKSLHLLSVPIEDLRIQAEQIREDNLKRVVEMKLPVNNTTEDTSKTLLWTEKFKPHTYLDLLSDDGTNRILLRWLKLWDKIVFDRDIKVRSKTEQQKGKQTYQNFKHFNVKKGPQVNEDLDAHNCPKQKVALLCGPPGLGKTTLAHIIARHAGYNAVEMNASDDRSAEAFRTQIEAATQMCAVLGSTPRPNCLIIDEIDGAPAAAINVLMNMINEGGGARKKGSKKKKMHRPIICICNDQYVPALRPLRQVALILNFPPTLPTRLASRLLEISTHERLAADMSSLLVLCEKANNDIRSCLSTLQFIFNKGKVLKVSDIQNLSIGQKDVQRSLFYVWQEIFQISSSVRNNTVNNNVTESCERYHKVLNTVQSFGDYDKIVNGVFENFLMMKTKNLQINNVADGAEWLIFHDAINQEIQHNQSYLLMAYLPYCPIKFHLLFASHNYAKITYPTAEYETFMKTATSQNLIASMKSEMTPNTRAFALSQSLILDILPLLMYILQPSLRPVNTQLYTIREKEELEHLVEIMIAYNVTYRQELASDGTCQYVLEPKFDQVSQFSGLDTSKQLTYAARQLIAREVELERLRRGEATRGSYEKTSPQESEVKIAEDQKVKLKPVEKKTISSTDKAVDFFGRPIQKPTEVTLPKENCAEAGDIWYHFKEGFSNAVRRNVRIQDLL